MYILQQFHAERRSSKGQNRVGRFFKWVGSSFDLVLIGGYWKIDIDYGFVFIIKGELQSTDTLVHDTKEDDDTS